MKSASHTVAGSTYSLAGSRAGRIGDEIGAAGPHRVDRHVGARIRMRRKELGVSQEKLAEALGLTFQQVQKYERAANRVSASKLWEIARALKTTVAYFYEGLETGETSAAAGSNVNAHEFLLTPEGLELASLFPQLPRARVRRKVVELVRALAERDEGERDGGQVATSRLRVFSPTS